jgi:hypothetical protein
LHSRILFVLPVTLLLSAALAFAQDRDLLQRVNDSSENTYSALRSFVCDEKIDRFGGTADGGRQWSIDGITTALSFENGVEHYGDIRQNAQQRSDMTGLSGAWSEGEFGTLLRQTGQLLKAEPVTFQRYAEIDGVAAAVYAFDVSEGDSPWELMVEAHDYRLAFHTEFWVSRMSGQILRVVRTAPQVAANAGIASIQWSVSLRPVKLNGVEWLLPASAEYAVTYAHKNRREWNHMVFQNYRRYGSQVALRFDLQ